MERVLTRKDTRGNVRGVTAVVYHPARKEVIGGFEGRWVLTRSCHLASVHPVHVRAKKTDSSFV